MSADITTLQNMTRITIDNLKATTTAYGLAGSGNEYLIMVQAFLYKFLNDKFIFEAKKEWKPLAKAPDPYLFIEKMPAKDYQTMCDLMGANILLEKEHLVPFVAARQNEPNFAQLFDATFESIADRNKDIFYISTVDNTNVAVLHSLSQYITGGTEKKNEFCKALITALSFFSFEEAFSMGYDFFSTVFEYLIKDYNANGGGAYAEYYTPHSIALIMAQLLVDKTHDLKNITCYDPAAGTGTLVIALAHIIGPDRCTVYTQDISDKSSTMMLLNLILNGSIGSLKNVVQGNTLTQPFHRNEGGSLLKFDYVVSNPPFKNDFSNDRQKLVNDTNKGRFFAGIPKIKPKDKDKMEIYLCFIQHVIYSLNDHGKAAVVVPTGFLTIKNGIGLKIRQHLVDNKILRGVISMPSNIFANTGTNVSVLFMDKTNEDDRVSLIDASKLGTDQTIGKNKKTVLSDVDVAKIVDTFKAKAIIEDFSVAPTYDEIKEKGYSFSAGQYFDIRIEYEDITEEEFRKRMGEYERKLDELFEEKNGLESKVKNIFKSCKYN